MLFETDLVHAEEHLELRHEGVARLSEDPHKHVRCEGMEGNHHWETPHKFLFKQSIESKLTLYGPNSFFHRFSGHNLR